MSNSILRRLYDGEICPSESINPKCTEYREINRTIIEEKQYFYKIMEEEGQNHFDNFDNLRYQWSSLNGYASFLCRFQLGADLMMEILITRQ